LKTGKLARRGVQGRRDKKQVPEGEKELVKKQKTTLVTSLGKICNDLLTARRENRSEKKHSLSGQGTNPAWGAKCVI